MTGVWAVGSAWLSHSANSQRTDSLVWVPERVIITRTEANISVNLRFWGVSSISSLSSKVAFVRGAAVNRRGLQRAPGAAGGQGVECFCGRKHSPSLTCFRGWFLAYLRLTATIYFSSCSWLMTLC